MKQTKTQKATEALIAHGAYGVKNRGHAFIIIKEAGLAGSGRVFNAAVAAFEEHFGVKLGDAKHKESKQWTGYEGRELTGYMYVPAPPADWESEKAFGYDVFGMNPNQSISRRRIFIPKKMLTEDGKIPVWLIDEKLDEVRAYFCFESDSVRLKGKIADALGRGVQE